MTARPRSCRSLPNASSEARVSGPSNPRQATRNGPFTVAFMVASSIGAGGRANHQFTDVDIGRLLDGIGDRAGDGLGRNGDTAEVGHGSLCAFLGNALGQLRFGHAGGNQSDANVASHFLAQAF